MKTIETTILMLLLGVAALSLAPMLEAHADDKDYGKLTMGGSLKTNTQQPDTYELGAEFDLGQDDRALITSNAAAGYYGSFPGAAGVLGATKDGGFTGNFGMAVDITGTLATEDSGHPGRVGMLLGDQTMAKATADYSAFNLIGGLAAMPPGARVHTGRGGYVDLNIAGVEWLTNRHTGMRYNATGLKVFSKTQVTDALTILASGHAALTYGGKQTLSSPFYGDADMKQIGTGLFFAGELGARYRLGQHAYVGVDATIMDDTAKVPLPGFGNPSLNRHTQAFGGGINAGTVF